MKKLFVLVLCVTASISFSVKLKDMGKVTVSNEYSTYYWSEKGDFLLVRNEDENGFCAELFKKGKKIGGGEFPVPPDILSNQCKRVIEGLDLKSVIVKYSNGSNVYFYLFKIGNKIEEIGKFDALSGNLPGICCPNIYAFNSGKWFGFKQRHTTTIPNVVKYVIFDKKLIAKTNWEIETPAGVCSDFSPNGKYIFAAVNLDSDGYTLEIYKTGKKIKKIADNLKSSDEYWQFLGKKDNIVYHQKTNSYYEVAKIGSYIPLVNFIDDDQVKDYLVDDKGNVAVIYTNFTIKVFTKNNTFGPFDINDFKGATNYWITDFNKNKIIIGKKITVNSTNDYYYIGYKISKKGLKKYKDFIFLEKVLDIYRNTLDKYIVLFYITPNGAYVNGYKKNLEPAFEKIYTAKYLPKIKNNGILCIDDDGTNTTFQIFKW